MHGSGEGPVNLKIGIECPDCVADGGLGGAVLLREVVELVDQSLGVNPAQGVVADVELASIIADNDSVVEEPMGACCACGATGLTVEPNSGRNPVPLWRANAADREAAAFPRRVPSNRGELLLPKS
jgi:hypothetical protein